MKTIEYWLDKYPELIHSNLTIFFILETLELVLKSNHFFPNKQFFHLIAGTSVIASTCATLLMGYLENKFYEKCKNEFAVNNGKCIEENWHRFLDDCYIALDATNINLLKLFDILNNLHGNIKFTMYNETAQFTSTYHFLIS